MCGYKNNVNYWKKIMVLGIFYYWEVIVGNYRAMTMIQMLTLEMRYFNFQSCTLERSSC